MRMVWKAKPPEGVCLLVYADGTKARFESGREAFSQAATDLRASKEPVSVVSEDGTELAGGRALQRSLRKEIR